MKVTTNFVNPSYPGFDSNTGPCSFKLRLHSDVCQVVKIIIVRVIMRMGMKMRMRELLLLTFLTTLCSLSSIKAVFLDNADGTVDDILGDIEFDIE